MQQILDHLTRRVEAVERRLDIVEKELRDLKADQARSRQAATEATNGQ